MSNETQDAGPLDTPVPVVCPQCGAEVPPPQPPNKAPVIGYHFCRNCRLVFGEPIGKPS